MPGLIPDEEDDLQAQQRARMALGRGGIAPEDGGDAAAAARVQTDPTDESGSAGLAPAVADDEPPESGLTPFTQPNDAELTKALSVPTGTQSTIGQEKLTATSQMAQGPRPTDPNAVAGAHHGWRKAADVLAGLGLGALTMNPVAGLGMYEHLNRAPLRKAQSKFDAQDATYNRNMTNLKTIEAGEQGEARIGALQGRLAGLTAERDARAQQLKEQGQKFVAGSEQEDPNSPTGWTAQTLGGERKPFTPAGSQKQTDAEKHAAIMKQREQDVKELGLTGDDAKYYRANGKLREPGTNIHVPSAEASEYQDWKAAYKRENGKDPDAKAIESYKRGQKTDTSKVPYMRSAEAFRDHYDNQQHGEYAVLQKEYDAARAKAVKENKDDGQDAINKAVGALDADFAQRKSKIDDKKSADADALGQAVQPSDYSYMGGGGAKPAAAPVAAQPQVAKPAPAAPAAEPHAKDSKGNTYKVGDSVMHKGVRKKVTGIENGKLILGQ